MEKEICLDCGYKEIVKENVYWACCPECHSKNIIRKEKTFN
jgi:predicted RNA-binding Zn-ribbon protein involved in translation (DUF1610 family)